MRSVLQLAAGVAVAGVVAAGSAAFTGAGVTINAANQFVGGMVSQSVSGAAITSVVYGFTADTSHAQINSITLNFTAALGLNTKVPTLALTGGGWSTAGAIADGFVCPAIAAETTICTPVHGAVAAPTGYIIGLSNVDITVP